MEGGGGRSSKGRASPFRKEASRPSGASRVPDRSGPDTWESHLDRPAGAPWVGGAVRLLQAAKPRALVSAGFEAQLVHFPPWACVCLGP